MSIPLLTLPEATTTPFALPTMILAVGAGDPKSPTRAEQVLAEMARLLSPYGGPDLPGLHVVCDIDDVMKLRNAGLDPQRTVILYDDPDLYRKMFRHTTPHRDDAMPAICYDAAWGVAIGKAMTSTMRVTDCAEQLVSDFVGNFIANLKRSGVRVIRRKDGTVLSDDQTRAWFPWGPAKVGETAPRTIALAAGDTNVLELLESEDAPDLRDGVAPNHLAGLPAGSKLSWLRVTAQPLGVDASQLETIAVHGFAAFERAARELVATGDPYVRRALLSGVHLDPRLIQAYLQPTAFELTTRRPDLHYGVNGRLYASESDYMPGGAVMAYLLDHAYGLNVQAWAELWANLTRNDGLLVFLVSTDWSAVYLKETAWLAEHLRKQGYRAMMLTTDEVDRIEIRSDGLFYQGQRIETINRLFPAFEATGKLVDIVLAGQAGLVRLTQEVALYANKTLFALFRSYSDFFAQAMGPAMYDVMSEILPDSHLLMPEADGSVTGFPFTIRLASGERVTVEDLNGLLYLPSAHRSEVVQKVVGDNPLSSRMYGVLMGNELANTVWQSWIRDRIAGCEPWLVQERRRSGVLGVPVYNLGLRRAEKFPGRVLLRPWVINGRLLSVTATIVPQSTEQVHGRHDMCATSCRLQYPAK